ncbi:hypothetical protein F5J12DRAFT_833441 [Pisolithus orientalis]|uniref:uncharacterized protein n=1 Tax=Pisolithus orientalis TaxID=936130 RepID=UPI002225226C|nr:uncharacterized protein F5J12DRAFT_833441 [Pisolithus orientalis]KAI6006283.1 hypothetical protein F5J12DRAFT_833441 [Pisolithus orientalis]
MFLPTLVSLLLLSASTAVSARSCVAFDVNWNLLAFNLDGKDWNAGTQDSWTGSGKATDITTTGRPPFNDANTTCYLSQYTNAIYVLNGDTSSPSSVYIYDATAKSWTTQAVTAGSFDPSSFDAILDHDTNVFYALSHDSLFSLDMGLLKAANSTPLSWTDTETAPYPSDYQPVMALAQNHIHFLDVPGVPAGSADIFVIHYSYFQPESQAYPLPNGSAFPATFGQATSFFQPSDVQQEFAFIPQDSSAVYVINVETNTTQALAGPTYQDPDATYFASVTALVQLTSNGTVSFLPYQEGNTSVNAAATWSQVSVLSSVAPPSTTTTSSTATGTKGGASATGSSSSGSNGALSITNIHSGLMLGAALGAVAFLF